MKRRCSVKRKSTTVSPQPKHAQTQLSTGSVSPQPQMSTRMLSPQPHSSLFHYTEVFDTIAPEDQYEDATFDSADLIQTTPGTHQSNDKAIQVDLLKDENGSPGPSDEVVEIVKQASKLEASIESSAILNLQNQTDQLQAIIVHIDVELNRLRGLVQDIADGRTQSNNTS